MRRTKQTNSIKFHKAHRERLARCVQTTWKQTTPAAHQGTKTTTMKTSLEMNRARAKLEGGPSIHLPVKTLIYRTKKHTPNTLAWVWSTADQEDFSWLTLNGFNGWIARIRVRCTTSWSNHRIGPIHPFPITNCVCMFINVNQTKPNKHPLWIDWQAINLHSLDSVGKRSKSQAPSWWWWWW